MIIFCLTNHPKIKPQGIFDNPQTGNLSVNVQSPEHTALALQIATAANVLLKNDRDILPIDSSSIKTIGVIGNDAYTDVTAVGHGSGYVVPPYIVSPLDGIRKYISSHKLPIKVTYAPSEPIDQAMSIAKAADIAIVFIANTSSEGADRSSLSMGPGQDKLISLVSSVQRNTVAVIHTPGAVLMPWEKQVAAIMVAFLPGQMDGKMNFFNVFISF